MSNGIDLVNGNLASADLDEGTREWINDYNECLQKIPQPGDILRPYPGEDQKAIITVELKAGAPPFMYGKVYVPEILGSTVGWFLQSEANRNFHGWKCILLPEARTKLTQKVGLPSTGIIYVSALRVVRPSKTGSSLLCEVAEY